MTGIIVKTMPLNEADKLFNVKKWGTWGCGAETFDWYYSESESCYILEGYVDVICGDETVTAKAGDMVYFPKGLACVWSVKQPIKKHYNFDYDFSKHI